MSKEIRKKQKDLYFESVRLKKINRQELPYEKSQKIHKEQTELYNKWKFFKGLNNAIEKGGKQCNEI